MSLVEYTREGLKALYQDIDRMAKIEGLDAHANSVNVRFS
jgi:histidinol dehydrogenase